MKRNSASKTSNQNLTGEQLNKAEAKVRSAKASAKQAKANLKQAKKRARLAKKEFKAAKKEFKRVLKKFKGTKKAKAEGRSEVVMREEAKSSRNKRNRRLRHSEVAARVFRPEKKAQSRATTKALATAKSVPRRIGDLAKPPENPARPIISTSSADAVANLTAASQLSVRSDVPSV